VVVLAQIAATNVAAARVARWGQAPAGASFRVVDVKMETAGTAAQSQWAAQTVVESVTAARLPIALVESPTIIARVPTPVRAVMQSRTAFAVRRATVAGRGLESRHGGIDKGSNNLRILKLALRILQRDLVLIADHKKDEIGSDEPKAGTAFCLAVWQYSRTWA